MKQNYCDSVIIGHLLFFFDETDGYINFLPHTIFSPLVLPYYLCNSLQQNNSKIFVHWSSHKCDSDEATEMQYCDTRYSDKVPSDKVPLTILQDLWWTVKNLPLYAQIFFFLNWNHTESQTKQWKSEVPLKWERQLKSRLQNEKCRFCFIKHNQIMKTRIWL